MNNTLTGKKRFRVAEFGLLRKHQVLVLQVEEHVGEGWPDANGMPEYLAHTRWRDAKPEDITTEG